MFLISNFGRVLNAVCLLLGNSPVPEFYMPTFRNTLSHLHRQVGMKRHTNLPTKMGQCSETSAYKIQAPENYLEESIQQLTCDLGQVFWFSHIVRFLLLAVTSPNNGLGCFFLHLTITFLLILFLYFIRPGIMTCRTISDYIYIYIYYFLSSKVLKLRICAFGIYIVRCMGFCISRVDYFVMYVMF